MENFNPKKGNIVDFLMNYMMKHHYEDYMNLKYEVLINTTEDVIKTNYVITDRMHAFDDIIKYFEEREEYEKCQTLVNLKKKVLS
jgi:hypothetical protein